MSFNPYQTTAQNFAEILNRHEQTQAHAEDNACYSHEVISVPNGQTYGKQGHVPSDHHVVFYYNEHRPMLETRSFDGNDWK